MALGEAAEGLVDVVHHLATEQSASMADASAVLSNLQTFISHIMDTLMGAVKVGLGVGVSVGVGMRMGL